MRAQADARDRMMNVEVHNLPGVLRGDSTPDAVKGLSGGTARALHAARALDSRSIARRACSSPAHRIDSGRNTLVERAT